jgi:hypothetical protein
MADKVGEERPPGTVSACRTMTRSVSGLHCCAAHLCCSPFHILLLINLLLLRLSFVSRLRTPPS